MESSEVVRHTVHTVRTIGLAIKVLFLAIAFPFVLSAYVAHDATADTLAKVYSNTNPG